MQMTKSRIFDLGLDVSDKKVISVGGMLGDRHMYAVSKLLAPQFTSLQGIQSTLLSQGNGFRPVLQSGGFFPEGWYYMLTIKNILYTAAQILFVPERHHWITVAYRQGEVLLYDSLF